MHFLLLIENVVNLPTKLMYENFSYIAIKKNHVLFMVLVYGLTF